MRAIVIGASFLVVTVVAACDKEVVPERDHRQSSARTNVADLQEPAPSPNLWSDQQAAAMIQELLGCDIAYVIRWENGHMKGSLELEGEDGSEASYDLSVPSKGKASQEEVGIVPDDAPSGWVVATMNKLPDIRGEAFDVRVEQQFVSVEERGAMTKALPSRRGRLLRILPADADKLADQDTVNSMADATQTAAARTVLQYHRVGSEQVIELTKYRDGQAVPWLEVQVGSDDSKPEAEATELP